jgi:hypothetical protein
MRQYKLKVTFIEDILGTTPLNEEVYTDYIASKHPDGEGAKELETLEESTVRGKTGFHRDEKGNPLLMDYMVKGFFKESWQKCREHKDSKASALKAGKSKITGHLFLEDRHIYIKATKKEYVLERPLRAETAQGPRVALAASDTIPAGATFSTVITVLAEHLITEDLLRELLNYGKYMGFGQWRSGGYGRFTYTLDALA